MDSNLNQLAPITDFDKAYVLAQQAHEMGFRGATFPELYFWLKGKLDLTGLSNTAGLPEEFPESGSTLEAANPLDWTILAPGNYNKIISGTIQIANDEFAFAQYDGEDFNRVIKIKIPLSIADGEMKPGDFNALSGDRAYRDIFDDGNTNLKSILLNKGKRYPMKNYFEETLTPRIRFKKALLEAVVYCNDSTEYNYALVQVNKGHSQSGNRIDIRKKHKVTNETVSTYVFRTLGTGSDTLNPANRRQLEKLSSGKFETSTIIADDNSFKVELTFDTSEFSSGEENMSMSSVDWDSFIFEESVYRSFDTQELPSLKTSISDVSSNMPNGFEDTGFTLDTTTNQWIGKANGVIETGGSAHVRNYTPVDRTKQHFWTGQIAGNQGTGVSFVDANNDFIEQPSNYIFNANGVVKNLEREPIVIPEQAAKWAFAAWDNFKVETGVMVKSASDQDLQSLKSDVNEMDLRVTDLEQKSLAKMMKAIRYEIEVKERKDELVGEYLRKIAENPAYEAPIYGVEWNENIIDSHQVTRQGTLLLHQTLPLQSKMRKCVMNEGIVQYYLHKDSDFFKEDGVTPSNIDGTDGSVMVEIPEGFWRTTNQYSAGVGKRIELTEEGVLGFNFSPKHYIAAYQSTIDRDMQKLVSVCTTIYNVQEQEIFIESANRYVETGSTGFTLGTQTVLEINGYTPNAARYRGNVNDATLDNETNPTSLNYARNNLGRPVANINRRTARFYAENANGLIQQYDSWKFIYYLIMVEFATRQLQQPIVKEKDELGRTQGGLGQGAVKYPDYAGYEKYFSPQGGTAVLPCGITSVLGSNSGEVYFRIKNVPVSSTGSGSTAEITSRGDVLMPVNSYRGIENIYGHLYNILDNVDARITNKPASIKDIEYYYQPNPYLTNDLANKDGYAKIWEGSFISSIRVIKNLLWGKDGHILPIGEGGSGSSAYQNYYTDCVELTGGWNGNISGGIFYLTKDGRIVSDQLPGLLFWVGVVNVDSDRSRTSDTVRLQYINL